MSTQHKLKQISIRLLFIQWAFIIDSRNNQYLPRECFTNFSESKESNLNMLSKFSDKEMSKKRSKIHFLFKIVIYLVCFLGFVWIINGELGKYFKKQTSISTNYIRMDMPYPDVIFCPADPFNVSTPKNFYTTALSKEKLDEVYNSVNVNLTRYYSKGKIRKPLNRV